MCVFASMQHAAGSESQMGDEAEGQPWTTPLQFASGIQGYFRLVVFPESLSYNVFSSFQFKYLQSCKACLALFPPSPMVCNHRSVVGRAI